MWYFDYWGKGTQVTVTSEAVKKPDVFTMSQCNDPSSDSITLGCLASKFSPDNSVNFKWTDQSGEALTDVIQYPSVGTGDKSLKISHITIKKEKWDQDEIKCTAVQNSTEFSQPFIKVKPQAPNENFKAKFALTLKPPIEREMFVNNKVILEAVVSGDLENKVKEASVSCKVDNEPLTSETKGTVVSNGISQFTRTDRVTVNSEKWFNGKTVTCTTTDKDNNKEIDQKIRFDKGDGQTPTVAIYKSDKNTVKVSHVCEVTSPKLGNVYIMWKVDGKSYTEGVTSGPLHQKDSTSVLSILTMTKEEYDKPSSTITCAVKHANMSNTSSPLQETASKSKGKESEPPEPETGFALNCNEDVLEEDEFRSLWSTATSFIFLFLFSLTYSAVLSLFKMKH